jgi:hypothetical protein
VIEDLHIADRSVHLDDTLEQHLALEAIVERIDRVVRPHLFDHSRFVANPRIRAWVKGRIVDEER